MTGLTDVHAHFLPPWYAGVAAESGHALPDGMPFWPAWSAPAHLELMERFGIQRSLLSLSTPGVSLAGAAENASLARRVNDFGAETVRSAPGSFGLLASLPLPDVTAAVTEAARALDELGADGVILQTHSQGTYLSEPGHEPLWELLADRRCVVLLHPTSPPHADATDLGFPRPMMEFLFDSTRVLVKLLFDGLTDRHPGLRLVVPHSGSLLPLVADRAELFQSAFKGFLPPDHPAQGFADVGDALGRLWWDLAGTPTELHLRGLSARMGVDRLVYGSDFCFTPEAAVTGQIAMLDSAWPALGGEPWREVTTANAVRLLTP